MAAKMKMKAFWNIAPCSLVGIYRSFRGAYCLHYHADDYAKTSVDSEETIRRCIQKGF
jgi:hypothetical protein